MCASPAILLSGCLYFNPGRSVFTRNDAEHNVHRQGSLPHGALVRTLACCIQSGKHVAVFIKRLGVSILGKAAEGSLRSGLGQQRVVRRVGQVRGEVLLAKIQVAAFLGIGGEGCAGVQERIFISIEPIGQPSSVSACTV